MRNPSRFLLAQSFVPAADLSQCCDTFGVPGMLPHIARMGKQPRFVTVGEFRAISRLSRLVIADAIRLRRFPVLMDERRGRLLIEAGPALAWAREAAKPGPPSR